MTSRMLSYLINFPLADKLWRLSLSFKKIFPRENPEFSPDIEWGDRAAFSNPWEQERPVDCRRGILISPEGNSSCCTCDYCRAVCALVNLRPGSRAKISAVQKAVSQGKGGYDIEPDILARLGAPTPLVPIKLMAECQSKKNKMAGRV